jgi:hypothetical protein
LAEEAKTFNPADYPAEVQNALRYANEECTAQGGGEVTFAPDTVRKIDLTGDGRDDYIVSFGATKCSDRESTYCGTGGCVLNLLVTLPDGRVRKVFDDYVRSYEIRPDPATGPGCRRSIRFELHGSYCGGHGSPSCIKEAAISAKPFAFKVP